MRRLGVIAVLVWAVCLAISGCSSTVAGKAVVRPGAASAPGKPHGLAGLLLSLDEMKQLLKFDDMGVEDTVTQPDARGIYEPAGCVGAVFSSMADSYDGSGYGDFYEVRLSDVTGGDLPHWVDQSVATFDSDSAASRFVARQVAQWRRCAGRQLTYAYPRPDDWQDTYRIGETIDSGCVTMISNVITGDKHYTDIRALAAKSNVVVDLQFTGFDLTGEPAVAINRILDRIASSGHECAFWT
ncbi:MAG TPA: sensor domain-containing protein [Mycobacterium sp.]|nr:sensor domain-containing protein [Mycobacterium sp.]